MRLALVCPYSLTVPGGVQGQVLGLARALRELGHDARVLGPCDGAPPDVGVVPLGKSVPTAANGSVAPVAPDPACVLRTIRVLGDEDFDVVHLHEPLAPGPTMTSVVFTSAPTVGTFHAAGGSAAYRWLAPLTRWMARRLTVRCAVSEDAQAMASRALGGQYVLVHNGIDLERFAKATPWPTDGPTLLFVGRHEPRKGLEVLLSALAQLPPEVRLWVVGQGPESRRLQALASGDGRVEWLGAVSDDELARRLRGADMLCAPSLYGESFGVVLLEAMAAQTAIVASDLPGYRTVARVGQEAVLVRPGDVEALAAAVRGLLDDPARASELVAAGEARAARFSMEGLAERYLEIYELAMASAGRRPAEPGRSGS